MDKKFLNKVLDQIVRETRIDYRGKGKIFVPFSPRHYPTHFSFHFSSYRSNFSHHCKNVYGLNDDEIRYVWNEYKKIIKDKIENNGL